MAKKSNAAKKQTGATRGPRRGSRAGEGDPVQPRATAAARRDVGRAQRAADPELGELSDEAVDRLEDPRDTDDDELAAARSALAEPDGGATHAASSEDVSSALAGGDVDAAATETGSGEEAVGGSSPTPDQDNVDEIGEALGVSYQPDEPLHTTEKIERRDDDRWELNPASSEDFAERKNLSHALPGRRRKR